MTSIFDFVKNSISIIDVISDYVTLKPAGSYYKGSCPFHAEKDASFTVSPDKGIFYCFGCHENGDLVSFIAKKENLSQFEALKLLIERFQLTVPENIKQNGFKNLTNESEKNRYFDLCLLALEWMQKNLSNNQSAKEYLTQRSIDQFCLDYFKIGYFPSGIISINNLIKYVQKEGFLLKDLLEAGIIFEGKTLYSPYEERIIFPIKDTMGRCCGFGGRIFKQNDDRPKYYNSKENENFLKGKLLFGLSDAKKSMQEKKYAFLVEGYTDTVAMVKHGYPNTVATLGTACTLEHLKLISRYIETLYIMYDGDNAGQNAILRLTQLCWDVNLELKIIKLPKSHDPASFLNESGNLESLIKSALDIFTFFIDSVEQDLANGSLSKKLALSEKIIEIILKIKDEIKQEFLLKQASEKINISYSALKNLLENKAKKEIYKKPFTNITNSNKIENNLLEERIFSAIIHNMDNSENFFIETDLIQYFSEPIQSLFKKIEVGCNFKCFLDKLTEPEKKLVIQCSLKFEPSISKEVFDQLVFHFCKLNWKKILQDLKQKMLTAKNDTDNKKFEELLLLFSKLKEGINSRGLI